MEAYQHAVVGDLGEGEWRGWLVRSGVGLTMPLCRTQCRTAKAIDHRSRVGRSAPIVALPRRTYLGFGLSDIVEHSRLVGEAGQPWPGDFVHDSSGE